MNQLVVVCFDIRDGRRLYRVARELGNFGTRVQRSIFECHLAPAQLGKLQRRLAKLIDEEEDQVRYYFLCPRDRRSILIDGTGRVTVDPAYTML